MFLGDNNPPHPLIVQMLACVQPPPLLRKIGEGVSVNAPSPIFIEGRGRLYTGYANARLSGLF